VGQGNQGRRKRASPSCEDKIIALQSQLKTMNKTLQKALSQATPANGSKEKDQKKPKKSKEWMSKKLKEGEPHTKKVNGKTYHWCEKMMPISPSGSSMTPSCAVDLRDGSQGRWIGRSLSLSPSLSGRLTRQSWRMMNRGYAREPVWDPGLANCRAPLLLIELILELVGATFGGMMLACICAIYIVCHKLVHYTTCTTAGRAVTSLTTSTISSITQHISGNSDKLYTIVALYNLSWSAKIGPKWPTEQDIWKRA
jgi:hypothetical protein